MAQCSDTVTGDEGQKRRVTAAIYYQPEAYSTSGPKLMGRHAAGESFLRGFFTYSKVAEFWVQVEKFEHAQHFAQTLRAFGRSEPVKVVDKHSLAGLTRAGVVYHPGPGIGEHAFRRAAYGHGAWSLCGITHTTSSAGAMDALAELITVPVQPWDAVICTSTAVKNNVERLLQGQLDYLTDRLGIAKFVLPQLPVISLGIHTQDFAFTTDQKAAARAALGVDEHTLVVLFMGRLSFHAKAHPLAMYQALDAAANATAKEVVLVECGWHANEYIKKAYADAARLACPSVRVVILDGRKAEDRRTAWAGADVFCSLSDNIQETFGIVPLEAMAAGLPVVVADWDGYRDTVRDGIDGFRIPTVMPSPGLGVDLALRHALEIDTYDMYCGHTCSLVAVDVQATAAAFEKLFTRPELRRQMGEAGKSRTQALYDWKSIIRQYEDLWDRLSEVRAAHQKDLKSLAHPWPARMDPFHAFASYPTQALTLQTALVRVDTDLDIALKRTLAYRQLAMVDFAKVILPSVAEVESVLSVAVQPEPAQMLLKGVAPERKALVFRSLAWLLKLGVLKVAPSSNSQSVLR
ncbi:MAG: glycosyltransferase [Betaproteobacteria bacterium]|nr:glycosyltransferase [Betaproteobacteria bacterium]